jgi:hypothetical protein
MAQKKIEKLVDSSTIIFKGTVQTLGSSNMPEVGISNEIGMVKVDVAILEVPLLGNITGTIMTIRFKRRQMLKIGSQAIFFTNVWIYASKIALGEVDHIATINEKDVISAMKEQPDRHLSIHLDRSELVMTGEVKKIERADVPEPISEHAPEWKIATINIKTILKGVFKDKQIDVLFASKEEGKWKSAPKLKEGQKGVFILHRGETLFAPNKAFTILYPLDVHPSEAQSRITKLIQTSGKKSKRR